MKRVLGALSFAAAVCLGAGGLADVIHQPGGGKIVGWIVEETEEYVGIKTRGGGVLRVAREDIDRIERGPVADDPAPAPAPAPVPAPAPAPATPTSAPLKPVAGQPRLGGGAGTGTKTEKIVFGVDEEAEIKKLSRDLVAWFQPRVAEIRRALPAMLRQRRKDAYEFIMDPKRYPDANHGAEAQEEVNRLVALLRRAWDDPFSEVMAENPRPRALAEALAALGALGPARARVNKALAPVQAPLDEGGRAGLEEARAVAAFNAKVPGLDPEERACTEATNRYRVMFGLRALRADERLVRAARKHSRAMVEHGFFDHVSPVPGMETPEKRVAAEGATYSAENIAFGGASGEGTFDQWYNSSGHHRNILGDHATVGIGKHETHWTQNFGKDVLR